MAGPHALQRYNLKNQRVAATDQHTVSVWSKKVEHQSLSDPETNKNKPNITSPAIFVIVEKLLFQENGVPV